MSDKKKNREDFFFLKNEFDENKENIEWNYVVKEGKHDKNVG